ncbi:RSC chromatin remodeling complex ATPase component [Zygosaccharomyces mellis]|uniref:RSC chromatin remodeling complex ATPase component n=1 Tax=Zygosaccharomyces mellis TaxID=42258 RepID=A0A4C2E6Q3_9SACH|nr:RSC chromatin remodeling complex ATPase component [Zygosaccharomyces mellis]
MSATTKDPVVNNKVLPVDKPLKKEEEPPSQLQQQQQEKETVIIPKPISAEQLEQLIYRYRAIQNRPKENKVEIEAIERTLGETSKEQDLYLYQLERLRNEKKQDVKYDQNLLGRQLLALQLLDKDMDIPDDLLLDVEQVETDGLEDSSLQHLDPVKVSLDFDENAKQLGVQDKFTHVFPTKLGVQSTEGIISSRIAKRISELERLPANLGAYSLDDALEFITKDDIPSNIDSLKIKALVELKGLKLLTKQKSLRQKLINNVASQAHHNIPYLRDSPVTMAAQRSVQVRSKVIVPQTVRLAEELERQQLLEKRKKERNMHLRKVHRIVEYVNNKQLNTWNYRDRCVQFGKHAQVMHSQIEKEEQKKVERNAKQRLAALKSNDEEAYLKLLDQTKDTRITQLLRQTNSFLDSLAQAVRVQQNEVKIMRGEEVPPITDEEREKVDYYEVAHRVKEKVEKQPSILVGGGLKEYQIRGLEWMVSLYNNHLNGILADEMGLGKTIQSISLITYLYEIKKEPGPFLVIVPLSTITNWTMEFEKWSPSLRTVVYKGTPNQRRSLQHQVRSGNFDVLLTTYEYIIKDRSVLSKPDWIHMIIDEGHRMKNSQSKLSYTITHYYHTKNRLILTGTPLQNNLPELWSLLNFVLPKIFNSAKTFEEWFNTPFANTGAQEKLELTEEETLLIIRRLHKVLRPFLLRRLKKEVEKDLPDKIEKVIKCGSSGLQQQLYQQMLKHNALFVGAGTEGATKGGIKGLNNKIMQLRKICNHPFVFDEVEAVINPSRQNTPLLYRVSGKFELLDRVLPKFKASGHRVLMFFQMTQVMDIMEDFLRLRDHKYMRLDGATKTEDRQEKLREFNAHESEYFCFLLSTRAGGLGLNLQSADTVIIFDTDWNPHQDLQAQDRAHRIGQKNEVRILRLITTDSVEEVILERAMQKLDIDGKVIQAGKFDNKSTAEEQEAFLRRLIENESNRDEEDKAELDDEELNEILARGDHEKVLFNQIDQQRIKDELEQAKAQGLKDAPPRLIEINELPEIFTEDITNHLDTEPVTLGRVRERKEVFYDDGLTEEQFLQAVEDENSTLDEAIRKRREARTKRQNRGKEEENEDVDDGEPEEPQEDQTEIDTLGNTPSEPVDESIQPDDIDSVDERKASNKRKPRASSRRKRTSSSAADENVAKEDEITDALGEDGDEAQEPDKKKPKLKIKLNLKKTPSTPENGEDGEQKPEPKISKKTKKQEINEFVEQVQKLFSSMREQVEEADGHSLTSIFEKLPSKREYPDYYSVIEKPVALDTIMRNAKKGIHKSMEDVRQELQQMYNNARFYNEEGSWVYNDADALEQFTNKWFETA